MPEQEQCTHSDWQMMERVDGYCVRREEPPTVHWSLDVWPHTVISIDEKAKVAHHRRLNGNIRTDLDTLQRMIIWPSGSRLSAGELHCRHLHLCVCSSVLTRQNFCGSVLCRSCVSCHHRPVPSTSTSAPSSQRLSSETWARGSMPSYRYARTSYARRRRASVICTIDCSAVASQRGWLWHCWSCCIWTTVMLCWLVVQRPHWHCFSGSYTPRRVLFKPRPCDPGSPRVTLVTSCREDPVEVVLAGTQVTCRMYARVYAVLSTHWHQSLMCASAICSALCALSSGELVVMWTRRWCEGFFCRRTASMEQAACRAEAAMIDHLFSSSAEIFLFQSAFGLRIQTDNCFVMHPWSPSSGRNTDTMVAVAVTLCGSWHC